MENNQLTNNYRTKVQYSRDFPRMFDLGDLSKKEEDITFSLLGEIADRYSPEGIKISYTDIAYMAGLVSEYTDKKSGKKYQFARTGEEFNELIENLQRKLKSVSYKKIIKTDEQGAPRQYKDFPLFTDHFEVNHDTQELTVYISDAIYQEEVIDESGNVVIPQQKIFELFNQENWSNIKYLKFGRQIHNLLRSKYSKRLYRFLSEYRNLGYCFKMADDFEEGVMKLNSPTLLRNKAAYIKTAYEEVSNMKDQEGNYIIPDLQMNIERKGRRTYRYSFNFKKFTNDLNSVLNIDKEGITLELKPNVEQNQEVDDDDFKEVLTAFQNIFGTDRNVDNKANRKFLKESLGIVDKEVIITIINRTGYKKDRTFGWTRNTLKKWIDNGVRTAADIEVFEANQFNKSNAEIQKLVLKDPNYKQIFDYLKELTGKDISTLIIEDVERYIEKTGINADLMLHTIRSAIFNNHNSWKDVKVLLDDFIKNDIFEVKQINEFEIDNSDVTFSDEFLKVMNLWSEKNE